MTFLQGFPIGLLVLLLPLLSCLIRSLSSGNKENLGRFFFFLPFSLPYFSTLFVVVSMKKEVYLIFPFASSLLSLLLHDDLRIHLRGNICAIFF
jgi:hypothetical protein